MAAGWRILVVGVVIGILSASFWGCEEREAGIRMDAPPCVNVPPPSCTPPAATYHYQHDIMSAAGSSMQAMAREFVIAVARVGDTSPTGSPFGDKQVQLPNNVTVKSSGQGGGETRTVAGVDESLRSEKLAAEPTPPGFGQARTAQLTSLLTGAGCFTVIERESINDILREQEFSSSEWVRPSGGACGDLAAVRYIVKGMMEVNQATARPVTPDDWTDPGTKEHMPYIFHLRMYSVATGQIVAAGAGYGDTPSAAIESSVGALRSAAMALYRQMHAAQASTQPATQPR